MASDICVFCRIVERQEPASIVYEDEATLAIMTIGPVNPGHVLVIPRAHFSGLEDLDEEIGEHVFKVGMRVQRAIRRSSLRCEGINMFIADGEAAFQDIFHFHLHVFPRFAGDGFALSKDHWNVADRADLDNVAALLKSQMG